MALSKIWARWNAWWAHGGVERKGRWGTYPLRAVFTKVVSPPWAVLVRREGQSGRETGFIPRFSAHASNARREQNHLNNTRHTYTKHTTGGSVALWLRCGGPSSHPGQDWIHTSPSDSLPRLSAFFFVGGEGTDRRADITGASGCSQGRLVGFYKAWQYWAGGILS